MEHERKSRQISCRGRGKSLPGLFDGDCGVSLLCTRDPRLRPVHEQQIQILALEICQRLLTRLPGKGIGISVVWGEKGIKVAWLPKVIVLCLHRVVSCRGCLTCTAPALHTPPPILSGDGHSASRSRTVVPPRLCVDVDARLAKLHPPDFLGPVSVIPDLGGDEQLVPAFLGDKVLEPLSHDVLVPVLRAHS